MAREPEHSQRRRLYDIKECPHTRNGILRFLLRDRPRHIVDPDMPLPPHPVEGEHDLAVQEKFGEPDRRDGVRCETAENPFTTKK